MDRISELMANPMGLNVKHTIAEPKIGDKIDVFDWEVQCESKEIARLAKLPHLTISEVHPIVVGENGDYHWEYQVYIEESHFSFHTWEFKILK